MVGSDAPSDMVRVMRAHSFVLDVSVAQRMALEQMADGRRAAYNFGLALDRDLYGADLPPADWADLELDYAAEEWNARRVLEPRVFNKIWTQAWHGLYPWSRSAGQPAQIAYGDYDKARAAFVKAHGKGAKARTRKYGFPKFRSRFDRHQTFTTRGISIIGDTIKIPNLDQPLRVQGSTRRLCWFLQHRAGTIQMAHLVRDGVPEPQGGAGVQTAWRCVVVIEIDLPEAENHPGPVIGLDLGLKRFATLSTGEIIANPKPLDHALARLRRAQKSVARSEKARQAKEVAQREAGQLGAHERLAKSGRHLAKDLVVARIHARVVALRREFHHQLANDLIARFSVIGAEDLNIAGMLRNKKLARHIADTGWASFLHILRYKAAVAGVTIVVAGRWYASSQKCSTPDCGFVNPALKDLAIRTWICPACGTEHDRDENAACNLVPAEAQIALARTKHLIEIAAQVHKRLAQKARAIKAGETKRAKRAEREALDEIARQTKHQARLAKAANHHAAAELSHPHIRSVAVTRTETLNARRGPVRPQGTTTVVPAAWAVQAAPMARTDEARTEQLDRRQMIVGSLSLGALGPPSPGNPAAASRVS